MGSIETVRFISLDVIKKGTGHLGLEGWLSLCPQYRGNKGQCESSGGAGILGQFGKSFHLTRVVCSA